MRDLKYSFKFQKQSQEFNKYHIVGFKAHASRLELN